MSSITAAGDRAQDGQGARPGHLVVLCHGADAGAAQMRAVQRAWRKLVPGAAFLRLNAPMPFERSWLRRVVRQAFGRRTWYSLQDNSPDAAAQGAREAAAALDRIVDRELRRLNLSARNLVLAGFSQGGMVALFAALRRPEPPSAVVCIAGAVLDQPSLPANLAGGPAVLFLHGEADRIVPSRLSHEGERVLRAHGVNVSSFYEAGAGHRLTPAMIAHAGRFVAEACALPPFAGKRASGDQGVTRSVSVNRLSEKLPLT